MRVLHVTPSYLPAREWGGVPVAVAGMAGALASAGVDVVVATTTQRLGGAAPPIAPGRRDVDGIPVEYFRSVGAMGRASAAPGLVPWLWRNVPGFDVVHVHLLWSFPGMLAAAVCRARGVPHVISPHGALDPWALDQRALEKRLFLAVAERRNLETASFLHFTTEAERAVAPAWVRALPAAVVPLAVDAAPFLALGRDSSRAASREVLLLARVHPMKGFDVLVPAMRMVVDRVPGARLVVAGPDEGGHLALVERAVREHGLEGSVAFTGHLEPAARDAVLARAAVMVAPSHRENFCLSIVEGMAAGLPVVVSEQVNIADDVAAAGAGIVVPRDPARLAEALVRLLEDPALRERTGEAGRRMVADRYSPSSVGRWLREAYGRAAAPRGR
jgi:glycosyltransferase involved in cell wall biosynthesis